MAKRRCKAVTKRGTRCTSYAINGSGRCRRPSHRLEYSLAAVVESPLNTDRIMADKGIMWLVREATPAQYQFVVDLRKFVQG